MALYKEAYHYQGCMAILYGARNMKSSESELSLPTKEIVKVKMEDNLFLPTQYKNILFSILFTREIDKRPT